jgi:hypothetical protein
MKGKDRIFTIHAKAFRAWFANRAQRVVVLQCLHAGGHLQMGERNFAVSSRSTEWAERTVRWPGSGIQRSYVLRDPFQRRPSAGARHISI